MRCSIARYAEVAATYGRQAHYVTDDTHYLIASQDLTREATGTLWRRPEGVEIDPRPQEVL